MSRNESGFETKALIAFLLVAALLIPIVWWGSRLTRGIRVRHQIEPAEIGSTTLQKALLEVHAHNESMDIDAIGSIIRAHPEEVNEVDRYLGRPIDFAAGMERLDIVKLLLEHGASPNGLMQIEGRRDVTLLQNAAFDGDEELVKLLLLYSADPLEMSRDGRSTLDIAKESRNKNVARLIHDAIIGTSSNSTGQIDQR
jgi:ankyrin repeat protein